MSAFYDQYLRVRRLRGKTGEPPIKPETMKAAMDIIGIPNDATPPSDDALLDFCNQVEEAVKVAFPGDRLNRLAFAEWSFPPTTLH